MSDNLLDESRFLLSEWRPERLPACSAEVAFVGRSNVGKSSLINAVCGKTLARVSRDPGRTRSINVIQAGHDRWLVDLPGYGFAFGPKRHRDSWEAMVEGYLTGRESLRMIFALIDAEVGPTEFDMGMAEWLRSHGLPWRSVAVKADKVKSSRRQAQHRDAAQALGLKPEEMAWVSARSGLGISGLRAEVAAALKP